MLRLLPYLLIYYCFIPLNLVFAEPIEENPLGIKSSSLTGDVAPESRVKLDLEVELKDGFFAYADKIVIKFNNPSDIAVGDINLDPLIEFADNSKKVKKGIKGKSFVTAQIEFPKAFSPQYEKIEGTLKYSACTKTYCLTPREVIFSIPIVYNHALAADHPKMPDQNIYYNSSFGFDSANVIKYLETNILLALVLIFLFGFLSSLTPCIYPLIPITLAVIGSRSDRGVSKVKAFSLSLVYVNGIALTYSLLGVFAAKTGGLFGSALGHPIVLVLLAILFFILSLSMFGFFEIRTPHFIQNKLLKSNLDDGIFSVFVSGIIAGVVASPCVGPVLVGILAYIAQTQNAVLGFLLLYTFALGLGVLLVLIGTFSSLITRLPKSGAWMNIIKNGFAVMMLLVAGFYLYQAIKVPLSTSSQMEHGGMAWSPYSEQKISEAKALGKPVIIDFYADWCAACVELDKFTFTDKKVQEAAKDFVLLKVDATEPFPELEDISKKYKVFGFPTVIFISKSGDVIFENSLTGFESADLFLSRMKKTLEK